MGILIEGKDGVVSTESIDPNIDVTWAYVTTHTYTSEMIIWCIRHQNQYGDDFAIQSYRLENHSENSHRWYFKDSEVATLFSIIFS